MKPERSAHLNCMHIIESAPVEAIEVALGSYSRLLDREVLARRPMHAGEHAGSGSAGERAAELDVLPHAQIHVQPLVFPPARASAPPPTRLHASNRSGSAQARADA